MARKSKSGEETCTLTLPLRLEKWQEDRLAKRLEIARQIYNTLLRFELKKLRKLEQSPQYRAIQEQMRTFYQEPRQQNDAQDKSKTKLNKQRDSILRQFGLSEYAFKSDMKNYYKHFSENIGSSVAVHGIAAQLWRAFDKKLYGNGQQIHYKSAGEMDSVVGYSISNRSGGIEIMFRGSYIEWKGLRLPLKLDPTNQYETDMLSKHVKYVRILRRPGKNKSRWYTQLSLVGKPAVKYDPQTNQPKHPVGIGDVGLDIGPQTLAFVTNSQAGLLELADRTPVIEHEKYLLQRKMDRSRRAANPGNYNADGTFKRGVRLTHNKSKRYVRLAKKLTFLQYQQASIRKMQHIQLANRLLTMGDCFKVEKMQWSGLAKRAKETTISTKTGRYNRKKRFGKSIANKAPAMLLTILEQKCKSRGIPGLVKIPTSMKASQYNHITDTYEKKELSQRWNEMPDGHRIQRDLYSAFLLQHVVMPEEQYDRDGLKRDYEAFLKHHDEAIQQLAHAPKLIGSMGLRRTGS